MRQADEGYTGFDAPIKMAPLIRMIAGQEYVGPRAEWEARSCAIGTGRELTPRPPMGSMAAQYQPALSMSVTLAVQPF